MTDKDRRRYRKIFVRMWGDSKFRSLSPLKPSGQALWIYLLTCPNGVITTPGVIIAGRAQIAEQLGWPRKAVDQAFEELTREGLVVADWDARFIWIPKAHRHNPPESPNVAKAWATTVDEVPECELKAMALATLEAFLEAFGEAFVKAFREGLRQGPREALTEGSARPSVNQEQEQEQEQEIPLTPKGDSLADKVQEVVDHYGTYHPKARFGRQSKEWALVVARLKAGYPPTDLKLAIDGYHRSPFHLGENDRKRKYLSIGLIFRDDAHVNEGIELAEKHSPLVANGEAPRKIAGPRSNPLAEYMGAPDGNA